MPGLDEVHLHHLQQEHRSAAELEHVADLYRWRYVGDPEIVAVATVNANWHSDVNFHHGIVTPKLRGR